MPHWYQICRSSIVVLHALAGASIFGYSLRRRKSFALRLPLAAAIGVLISYLIQNAFYQPGITADAILTQAAVQIVNYLLVIGAIHFCMDESFWTAMYLATSGMAAQGLAGCLKAIVKLIPFMNSLAVNDLGIIPLDILCYGGVFLVLHLTFRSFTSVRQEAAGNRSKAIISTTILFFYLANTWLIRDYSNGQMQAYVVVTNVYAIMVQFLIFMVQFNVMERGRLTQNIEIMQELMHQQRLQYEASWESVQLINEKYHDLKNLVNSMKNVLPEDEIHRLKDSIVRYDVKVRTGFEVLDVVLTEKMNQCLQRNITMTCYLGKTDFAFLEEMDLYTLFNNALTNAINAVSALPDTMGRYIMLTAEQDNNMVTIHVENPCQGEIALVDGLPRTSRDPDWHGFGMKSMLRTAEKYGGTLSVSQSSGLFQLDILLLDLAADKK